MVNSTLIGVSIAVAGGLIQSSGFIAQKTGHNQCNKLNDSLCKEDHKSVLSRWVWWVGIVVYTCGGFMNTIALNFAAQSIVAWLGAVNPAGACACSKSTASRAKPSSVGVATSPP